MRRSRTDRAGRATLALAAAAAITIPAVAGCGGTDAVKPAVAAARSSAPAAAPAPRATEVNPPGDIPDNQVYVPYTPQGAGFSVKVPEGWARAQQGTAVTFTDKLNTIRIDSANAGVAPSVASIRRTELPSVQRTSAKYQPGSVKTVKRAGGTAVLAKYEQDSAPDPVTGKVIRDAVERYDYYHAGRVAILTLSGPQNADNVDPWRIVSDSLRWR